MLTRAENPRLSFTWLVGIALSVVGMASGRADILIATAGPFTGTNIFRGEQIQHGAEMAVADINDRGGILGERVELLIADDACDPEQAVAGCMLRELAWVTPPTRQWQLCRDTI